MIYCLEKVADTHLWNSLEKHLVRELLSDSACVFIALCEIDNSKIQPPLIYVDSNIVRKGLPFWDNNILVSSFAIKYRVVDGFHFD